MAVEYTIEIKNDFIWFRPEGATDQTEELLEYIDSILADCREQGTFRMLLDHRNFQFNCQYSGYYDLALQTIERMSPDRPLKVALLTQPERVEFLKFYETIGVGRGATIKVFDRMKMASVWLAS